MIGKKKTEKRASKERANGTVQYKSVVTFSNGKTGEIMPPNLFSDWMGKKVLEYEEPQRKGTPKGEVIGFGKKKYTAVLMSLTNIKGKHLAKIAGVSYGVLRKWRTEQEFKVLLLDFRHEFADYFCDFVIQDQINEPTKISEVPKILELWRQAMLGNKFFSDDLKEGIVRLAGSRFINKTKADKQWWKKQGLSRPTESQKILFLTTVEGEIVKGFRKRLNRSNPEALKKVVIALLRQHIHPEKGKQKIDKKDALVVLDCLEKWLEIPEN